MPDSSITRAHGLRALPVGFLLRVLGIPGFPTPTIRARFLGFAIGDALRDLSLLPLPMTVGIGLPDNNWRRMDTCHPHSLRRHDTSSQTSHAEQRDQKSGHWVILSEPYDWRALG